MPLKHTLFFAKLGIAVYSWFRNMKHWLGLSEWTFTLDIFCNRIQFSLKNDIIQFQHLLSLHNAVSSTSHLCCFLHSQVSLIISVLEYLVLPLRHPPSIWWCNYKNKVASLSRFIFLSLLPFVVCTSPSLV